MNRPPRIRELTKHERADASRRAYAAKSSPFGAVAKYGIGIFVAVMLLVFTPTKYLAQAAFVSAAVIFFISRAYLSKPEIKKSVDEVIERNGHFRGLFLGLSLLTGSLSGVMAILLSVPKSSASELALYAMLGIAILSCMAVGALLKKTRYLSLVGAGYGSVDKGYAFALAFSLALFVGLMAFLAHGIHWNSWVPASVYFVALWLAVMVPSLYALMIFAWPLAIMRLHWFNIREFHKAGSLAYKVSSRIEPGLYGLVVRRGEDVIRAEDEGLRAELAKHLHAQGIDPTDRNIDLAFNTGLDAMRRAPFDKTSFTDLVDGMALSRGKLPVLAKLAIVSKPPLMILVYLASLLILPLWILLFEVAHRIIAAKMMVMERREAMQPYTAADTTSKSIVK